MDLPLAGEPGDLPHDPPFPTATPQAAAEALDDMGNPARHGRLVAAQGLGGGRSGTQPLQMIQS
jgi:hypothetical protein